MICDNCGKCCESLESLQIFEFMYNRIKEDRPEIEKLAKKIGGLYYIDLKYESCPFYISETKKCSIYRNRPLICREFPFKITSQISTPYLVKNFEKFALEDIINLTLCERFETVTEEDYKKAIKIMKLSVKQYALVFKKKSNHLFLNKHIEKLEAEIDKRKYEKEIVYFKYLELCKANKNYIRFTKLLLQYFKDRTLQYKEYKDFLDYYIPKFYINPLYINLAINDLEKRIENAVL